MHGLYIFIMVKNLSQEKPVTLLDQTKKLLRRYGLRAKKGLGQNFLVDEEVLATILATADLAPAETVIEVGPGLGLMTAELAKNAGWVIAVELDNRLADILKKNLPGDNIVVINQDVLGTNPCGLLQEGAPRFPEAMRPYKVVANLPYYITSPVIRHFLEASVKPEKMVIMVQKEVAEAIVAGPGQRSVLSISVQFYGKPIIVTYVPATSFYPAPEVDSAVVGIDVYASSPIDVNDENSFFKLVRAGFTSARKQVANSLERGLGLPKTEVLSGLRKADIDPTRRAETFTLEEWARLLKVFRIKGDD